MSEDLPKRRSTPRPVPVGATLIRREDSAHHVWGDPECGFVTDRVYLSTGNLHVLEFELGPGGSFTHSPMNQTIFAAEVTYCVLEGNLILADPSTGEMNEAGPGNVLAFGPHTWHHGFNASTRDHVRVLEFFAPPPSRGTASEYARRQPPLLEVSYRDDRWSQRWPKASEEQQSARRIRAIGPTEGLLSLRDCKPSHRQYTIFDGEHLLVRRGVVTAGHVEDLATDDRESALLCTSGELWVDMFDGGNECWVPGRLLPGDAAFAPAGTPWRVLNRSSHDAEYLSGHAVILPEEWTCE